MQKCMYISVYVQYVLSIYLSIYLCWCAAAHACRPMCVRLANNFINVKTETK